MSKDNLFGFSIPNLDDTLNSPEEYAKASDTLYLLSQYLNNKRLAMMDRNNGHIQSALNYECKCDLIWKKLPEWARW